VQEMMEVALVVTDRQIEVLEGDHRFKDHQILLENTEKAHRVLAGQPKYTEIY
jgi:UDP-glucose 4-epimerase